MGTLVVPFAISVQPFSVGAKQILGGAEMCSKTPEDFYLTCPTYDLMSVYLFLEFQKLWRSVPVDSMDDEKIEEYLKRQGISSMQESGPKKIVFLSALS
ncbi:hypothetical protein XELAEV_18009554mg [Xenopus laevis]|uniref:Uncharacterized protein n=1 Tax=Xenopus laevis TaxID=8355 RepID=A0A974DSY1_XENLA|nr:hypothetical protein XELAEV_18009554mg [Xenopus laevis]